MPVMDGLEVTQRLTVQLPSCLVIILSGNDYDAFSKRAMLAGAKDYVSKPVDLEAVTVKIIDTVAKARDVEKKAKDRKAAMEKAAKIFAFYSPKGSAGSTSLAVNAALELARGRQRVLLIDLNLQFGDIEFLLDLKSRACISSLIGESGELLTYKVSGLSEDHRSGMRVLFQHRLEESELLTPAHIATLLKQVRSSPDHDFVLLDLARQLDERTLSAIDAADTLFLVVTEDYLSVKNAKLCMELFKKLGYTDTKVKVLVNKVTGPTSPHVATQLGAVFSTFPLQAKLFEQSVKSGFPPIIEHPENPFSQAVSRLVSSAMLLRKSADAPPPAEEAAGIGALFKRLFS
jgi:pilus assembly protein CpaE